MITSPIINIKEISNKDFISELDLLEKNALQDTMGWVHDFLCKPNLNMGREGIVCPFTPSSLNKGLFWITFCREQPVTMNSALTLILELRDWFLEKTLTNKGNKMFHTILILFPNRGKDNSHIIEKIQKNLKMDFVQNGLMVGQFYQDCEESGLWNSDFKPLQSPIPMIAIRNMVPSDFPFLSNNKEFVESYMKLFREEIPPMLKNDVAKSLRKFRIKIK